MGHLHEKIDFVVGLFVVFDNKVLVVDHKKLNKWICPGGHIELDEDPEQALFRELKEETGLERTDVEILSSKPQTTSEHRKFLLTPNFVDIHKIDEVHKHVAFVYFMKSKTSNVVLEESAHKEIKWVGEDDINSSQYNFDDGVKFYIKEVINKAAQ
jgi:8-oxo-dGTP pyrophosphatase MutT (NUDIX family)